MVDTHFFNICFVQFCLYHLWASGLLTITENKSQESTADVWELISNVIEHIITGVISYPYWN